MTTEQTRDALAQLEAVLATHAALLAEPYALAAIGRRVLLAGQVGEMLTKHAETLRALLGAADGVEALHLSVCQAVQLMQTAVPFMDRAELIKAQDILRESLISYANATLTKAPADD